MSLDLTTKLLVVFLLSLPPSSANSSGPPDQPSCSEGQPLLDSVDFLECKKAVLAKLVVGGYYVTRLMQTDWQVRDKQGTYLIMMILMIMLRLRKVTYQSVST